MRLWREVCDHLFTHVLWRGGDMVGVGGMPSVHTGDFADPFVLWAEGAYYAYATQTGSTHVQVMRSEDLAGWEPLGNALPDLPAWACSGWTWAPVVLPRDGSYVLYYTVREPRSGRQAISVAASDRPEGPFIDRSTGPLVFQLDRGGSIDPSPFVDRDATPYLLWKSDDNALDLPSSLWGQPLAADGMSLVGEPTELLRQDRRWERPLIEAPSMVEIAGAYHLFYSANWWESRRYAVGHAVASRPMGPFTKLTTRRPWIAARRDMSGPGGQEFFLDADGELRMAFHAWTPGSIGYAGGGARSLRIASLEFHDGRPVVRATARSTSPGSRGSP